MSLLLVFVFQMALHNSSLSRQHFALNANLILDTVNVTEIEKLSIKLKVSDDSLEFILL
jgi:hypothetical protein